MVVLDVDLVFLVVLLIILAIVVYIELRFMRTRNREYLDKAIDKDDAYNNIATTKAIASALRQKGKDTREAELVIIQAEQAYNRGSFVSSKESAKKARDILINAPFIEMSLGDAPKTEPKSPLDEEHETAHEVTKLEPNLIESRFIINSCRAHLEAEEACGKDIAQAKERLAQAEQCFAEKRYDEALKEGMRARRMMGVSSPGLSEPKKEVSRIKIPKPERKCVKCGIGVPQEDLFCRKCGTRVEVQRTCSHCQTDVSVEDAFCPKCGRRI
ncbi:MAG TPA: zinc ribbon domain-containing protein [Methanomassiliicoccales archaeon]|nr:zinc ribbon domain-containing protein [Methanomassiliicoccales archaeon]